MRPHQDRAATKLKLVGAAAKSFPRHHQTPSGHSTRGVTSRVAVPSAHSVARRCGVALPEVLAEPIFARSRREYLDYHALLARIAARRIKQPRIAEECDSGISLIARAAGKGVAIVIASLADTAGHRLRYAPFSPPAPAVVGVAYVKDAVTPLTAAFLEAVCTTRGV